MEKVALQLDAQQLEKVEYEIDAHEDYANSKLEDYCGGKNIVPAKNLSECDSELLATAIVLDALIATDEWPLNFVVDDLLSVPDDGYNIGVITSVHVLHLLEGEGLLSAEERRDTVRAWLRYDEKLRRDWREIYQQLFNERAPTL